MNNTDFILLPSDQQYYLSIAVHDHILNSMMTIFIIAFLVGHGFGFFSRELYHFILTRLRGIE